jgi:hypothetical protein
MIYLFQRIIQNHFQWTRPSPGRLGPAGEGEYVQKNGFGHEDWNFNQKLSIKGHLYGYCYYRPSSIKASEHFNILFATYVNGKWYAIGFYLNTEFDDDSPVSKPVLNWKRNDLLQLGASLGKPYRNLSREKFIRKLESEAQWLKWRVKPTDAIRAARPIEIPKFLFRPTNYRITKPTEIEKKTFDAIFSLASRKNPQDDITDETEFPEGKEVERTHKQRERNALVVTVAKRNFREKHGRLFCQICGFDFKKSYGEIGVGFIEAHHTIPVSNKRGILRTKPSDIAVVCPNCHRMLHRKRPWLKMSDLKNLIVK